MWYKLWRSFYYVIYWPMWKWTLRKLTGQCELLRITYWYNVGNSRTAAIESSLKHSKTQALKRLLTEDHVDVEQAVADIMRIKSVSPEVHPQFGSALKVCLCQICGYRQLFAEVESARRTPYSSDNVDHERLLLQLWSTLRPDQPLTARVTKQWSDIGFQGDDPMTDFRGMGILGLHNLVFFVTEHREAALQMVTRSNHPQYGYSFAIVGINITGLTYQLLTSGHLKTHFYNVIQGRPRMEHFHHVYSYLLYQFDQFWFNEKPRDIMEFNRVKEKFHKSIVHRLRDKTATLTCTFPTAAQ